MTKIDLKSLDGIKGGCKPCAPPPCKPAPACPPPAPSCGSKKSGCC